MTQRTALFLLMLLAATAVVAQPVPVPGDLSATLDPTSGEVALNWTYDTDPGDGYSTDFDTDDLTGWELDNPDRWTLDPDNSVLGTVWTPAGDWWWSVASYTAATYDGASELTATLRRTDGQENWAQSMFICGAGVFEPPAWTGFMVQIEVSATPQYNVTRVYEGSTSFVTNGWNDTPYINTGIGAWNTMTVQTSGTGEYTLILNGEAVFDWQDDQIMGGMVSIGGVGEPGVPQAIEWDAVSFQPLDIATAAYGTAPVSSSGATLVIGGADPRGAEMAWDGAEFLPQNGTVVSELDDFLEFEIYRDDQLVGTTSDLSYTDTLPQPDEYLYTVVAVWDEGDSDPSPATSVTWLPLTLLPGVVDVPAGGGDVTYDVTATVAYPNPLPNLTWAISVTTPAGTVVPVSSLMVNLPPNYQGTLTGQTLTVPAWAPPGTYTFTGTLGYPGTMTVSDSFEFTKQGAATGQAFQPSQIWPQE